MTINNQLVYRERELNQMQLIKSSFSEDEQEQWIELPLHGNYSISSFGRIMRVNSKRGKRILCPTFCSSGFYITIRTSENHSVGKRVDRLMGWFRGHKYESIRTAIHLDNNRFNNNLKNLEFVLWN